MLAVGKLELKKMKVIDGEALGTTFIYVLHICITKYTLHIKVTFLLDHNEKQTELISLSFNNDTRFTTARDQAFVALLNDPSIFEKEGKCPEILANHIDALFRYIYHL